MDLVPFKNEAITVLTRGIIVNIPGYAFGFTPKFIRLRTLIGEQQHELNDPWDLFDEPRKMITEQYFPYYLCVKQLMRRLNADVERLVYSFMFT